MSDWVFIGAAFGVTWLGLAGYALYVARRNRRAEAAARELGVQEVDA